MPMTSVGLLLAAGSSIRFGDQEKLLASYRGAPLAQHAANAMRNAGFDHLIAVVSNPALEPVLAGFEIITIASQKPDLSNSLKAGLQSAMDFDADRIIIALADMPNIRSETLSAIDKLSQANGVAACASGGKITPPAAFGQTYFLELMALQGDTGARRLLAKLPATHLIERPAQELADIDAPDDLIGSQ